MELDSVEYFDDGYGDETDPFARFGDVFDEADDPDRLKFYHRDDPEYVEAQARIKYKDVNNLRDMATQTKGLQCFCPLRLIKSSDKDEEIHDCTSGDDHLEDEVQAVNSDSVGSQKLYKTRVFINSFFQRSVDVDSLLSGKIDTSTLREWAKKEDVSVLDRFAVPAHVKCVKLEVRDQSVRNVENLLVTHEIAISTNDMYDCDRKEKKKRRNKVTFPVKDPKHDLKRAEISDYALRTDFEEMLSDDEDVEVFPEEQRWKPVRPPRATKLIRGIPSQIVRPMMLCTYMNGNELEKFYASRFGRAFITCSDFRDVTRNLRRGANVLVSCTSVKKRWFKEFDFKHWSWLMIMQPNQIFPYRIEFKGTFILNKERLPIEEVMNVLYDVRVFELLDFEPVTLKVSPMSLMAMIRSKMKDPIGLELPKMSDSN